ncbi:MAG: hypothetical protein DF168_00980 [Candidatus Moanabacter tarae]|uniref:Major facilitator superfamily (MFS) profile domain-containing protein n=1 Tax=Candidatus Moanibacter tarae TaxID=2200854 RepID=A0A2Z4AEC4_9BACT|nr:MAG: hypothetical protein DF168_00980 [Candidatus Moanabacter tarae]|tara:strand:- start:20952 stop:22199 length:1248 start_codon:yes stop_codon:yes gene_type:complete
MRLFTIPNNFRLREFSRNVKLFYIYGLSLNAGMALFTLLYNLYLLRLSFREDLIGQIASMGPLATGLLALPIGMLSDRIGRKIFLVGASVLLAVSQIGLCFSTATASFFAFSFIGGIAMACIWVNHVPFLSDNTVRIRRAEALALWTAMQIVVRMFCTLIGGMLPGVMGYFLNTSTEMPEPFRYSLLIGAACSLLSVLPLIRMPHRVEALTGDKMESRNRVVELGIQWRTYFGFTVSSGARGFAVGLTFPFFNVFFQEELYLGPMVIGVIYFLSEFLSLPSIIIVPKLMRRFGAPLTMFPLRSIWGGAIGIMGTVISLPISIVMFLISRVSEVIDNPIEQIFSTELLPRYFWARIQGFRVCGFQILAFAGSILGGFLIVEYGYYAAFVLACLSRIASGIFVAVYFGSQSAPPRSI